MFQFMFQNEIVTTFWIAFALTCSFRAICVALLKRDVKKLLEEGRTTEMARDVIKHKLGWYAKCLIFLSKGTCGSLARDQFLKRFTYAHFGKVEASESMP